MKTLIVDYNYNNLKVSKSLYKKEKKTQEKCIKFIAITIDKVWWILIATVYFFNNNTVIDQKNIYPAKIYLLIAVLWNCFLTCVNNSHGPTCFAYLYIKYLFIYICLWNSFNTCEFLNIEIISVLKQGYNYFTIKPVDRILSLGKNKKLNNIQI